MYLPSGYAQHPNRRYSVLYLLHGFPGRPLAFLSTVRMGIIDDILTTRHRAQPLILVMPFGSTGTFNDQEWVNGFGAGNGWSTFVSRDLVQYIDAHYRTIATAHGRAVAGLSEGGYGAINIALQHPREFSVVESWSGYMRPDKLHSIFGRTSSSCPQTILGCSCDGSARLRKIGTRTSGSTLARQIATGCRTRRSHISSLHCTCPTRTGSSSGATPGRSGARTQHSPISRQRGGSRMVRVARSIAAVAVVARRPRRGHRLALSRAAGRARSRVRGARRSCARRAFEAQQRFDRSSSSPYGGSPPALLGLVARWAHTERLTAGLLLALGTGVWLYVLNGVSILVVRQISAHEAFHAAAAERAVVIPAALAGIGGALLGRSNSRSEPRARLVLAWLVAGVALLAAFNAVFPEHRRSLITTLDPAHVHGLAKALVAPARRRACSLGARPRARESPCVAGRPRPDGGAARAQRRAPVQRRRDRHRHRCCCARRAARRLRPARRSERQAAHLRARRGRCARGRHLRACDALGEPHDGG